MARCCLPAPRGRAVGVPADHWAVPALRGCRGSALHGLVLSFLLSGEMLPRRFVLSRTIYTYRTSPWWSEGCYKLAGRPRVLASPSHCPSFSDPGVYVCFGERPRRGFSPALGILLFLHGVPSCVYFHHDFYLDLPHPALLSGMPRPQELPLTLGSNITTWLCFRKSTTSLA